MGDKKQHIATAPSYSPTTRRRVGTVYLYTEEEIARHEWLCQKYGLAPGIRRRPAPPPAEAE